MSSSEGISYEPPEGLTYKGREILFYHELPSWYQDGKTWVVLKLKDDNPKMELVYTVRKDLI